MYHNLTINYINPIQKLIKWGIEETKNIAKFLNDFEQKLITNNYLNSEKLSNIKNKLKEYSEFLDNKESTTFIYFIVKLLKEIGEWSYELINKTIKKIYHL
jgi:hypothetical protein